MDEEFNMLERLITRFKMHNWWDNVFLFLYVVVFGGAGLLMKFGVVEYPKTFSELFIYLFNTPKELSWYFVIFYVVFVTNIIFLLVFLKNDYGAYKLLKNGDSYYYIDNRSEKIVGSIAALIVSMTINIFLFPMFLVMYIALFLVVLCASSSTSR